MAKAVISETMLRVRPKGSVKVETATMARATGAATQFSLLSTAAPLVEPQGPDGESGQLLQGRRARRRINPAGRVA